MNSPPPPQPNGVHQKLKNIIYGKETCIQYKI
jgi:hypothetical protein